MAAGEADELLASIVVEARAELLEWRPLPAGGKHVHALRCLWPVTSSFCSNVASGCLTHIASTQVSSRALTWHRPGRRGGRQGSSGVRRGSRRAIAVRRTASLRSPIAVRRTASLRSPMAPAPVRPCSKAPIKPGFAFCSGSGETPTGWRDRLEELRHRNRTLNQRCRPTSRICRRAPVPEPARHRKQKRISPYQLPAFRAPAHEQGGSGLDRPPGQTAPQAQQRLG
jgi:hypothetical protein